MSQETVIKCDTLTGQYDALMTIVRANAELEQATRIHQHQYFQASSPLKRKNRIKKSQPDP